jgi:hypothetical protein
MPPRSRSGQHQADEQLVPDVQWHHPGSTLSFASGSALKRITAGVKARRGRTLLKFRSAGRAFTLRQSQFRTKKEYSFPGLAASPSRSRHWPVILRFSSTWSARPEF